MIKAERNFLDLTIVNHNVNNAHKNKSSVDLLLVRTCCSITAKRDNFQNFDKIASTQHCRKHENEILLNQHLICFYPWGIIQRSGLRRHLCSRIKRAKKKCTFLDYFFFYRSSNETLPPCYQNPCLNHFVTCILYIYIEQQIRLFQERYILRLR